MNRWPSLAIVLAIPAAIACSRDPETPSFHDVRLGMSAKDVRDRFEAPSPGSWTVTPGEDMFLDWKAVAPSRATLAAARFEFHNGMLVAVRADLPAGDALASGPPLATSPASVLVREKREGGVGYRLIARDCPAHRDEVSRILAR